MSKQKKAHKSKIKVHKHDKLSNDELSELLIKRFYMNGGVPSVRFEDNQNILKSGQTFSSRSDS